MTRLLVIRKRIEHFEMVDKSAIRSQFFDNRNHRATLVLPFVGRTANTLCVIGQNPSAADERYADRTIRYLEEFVYRMYPTYGTLPILNLYSRIDTNKSMTSDPLHERCASIFNDEINGHQDFLLIYGKAKREGSYKFPERIREVASKLHSKNLFKLDIGTPYPPHPGNRSILYRNFNVSLAPVQI